MPWYWSIWKGRLKRSFRAQRPIFLSVDRLEDRIAPAVLRSSGTELTSFFAFDPRFSGGVSVASADFNGDGVADLIAGAGPGAGSNVAVFDGRTGSEIRSFYAFAPSFLGGIRVAAGDVNRDGTPDIIVGAGPGAEPHVVVFDGKTGTVLSSFFAFDPGFAGGVNVAAGDVNGDGYADIIAGAGPGAGPQISVFDGKTGTVLSSFFAFDPGFAGGVNVAAGDVYGDGFADIVVGAGPGAGPQISVFDGKTGTVLSSFYAFDRGFAGGVNVASGDMNGDGFADIVAGAGPGAGPHVKVFDGRTGSELGSFFAYDEAFEGGVNVATGDSNGDGVTDIVTGAMAGLRAGPHVKAFDFNRPISSDPVAGTTGNFAPDLAGWSTDILGGTDPTTGRAIVTDGVLTLAEGSSFRVGVSQAFTVPAAPTSIRITFETPDFDTGSLDRIRDAFEIAVLDSDGNPLALPIGAGRDASFNWSEQLAQQLATGTTGSVADGLTTVTINLSSLPIGTAAKLALRLVNDDTDTGTTVRIRRVDFVSASGTVPAGVTPAPARLTSATPDLASLSDVTPSAKVVYAATTLNQAQAILTTGIAVQNTGSYAFVQHLLVAIGNLSDPSVGVLHPDGYTADGRAYFDLTPEMGGQSLAAGQSTASRSVQFRNPNAERFTYDLQVLAALDPAPTFTSTPSTLVQAGQSYHYTAQASTPAGSPLAYSLLAGPSGLTIDPTTGAVRWTTSAADIGNNTVRIRATDSLGQTAEQDFAVTVQDQIANRPPVFTSTPPTDATVAAPFEVQTFKTGNNSVAVTAGNFGNGMSFVTANPGDASLGLLGPDRVSTPIGVGEPNPGALQTSFVTPIPVDLGFSPNTYTNTERDLDNMVTGDVDGDGTPDLIVSVSTGSSNYFDPARVGHVGVRFGNGDGTFRQSWEVTLPAVANRGSAGFGLRYVDVTGDGVRDILLMQYLGNNVLVYKGIAGGTFENAPIVSAASGNSSLLQVADFNGDGAVDVVRFESNSVDVLFGNGDGTFGPQTSYAVATSNASSLGYVADVDGQNGPDIVRIDGTNSRLETFLNDGTGHFSAPIFSGTYALVDVGGGAIGAANVEPDSAYIGDFDGDGIPDASIATNQRGLLFLKGQGNGAFGDGTTSGNRINVGGAGSSALTGQLYTVYNDGQPFDFNADGLPDVIVGDSNYGLVTLGLGRGDGNFFLASYNAAHPDDIGTGARGNQPTYQFNIADYNRDGVLDVAVASPSGSNRPGGAAIILGDQVGTLRAVRTVPNDANGGLSVAADFTGDGIPDLLNTTSNGLNVATGNGDGTFASFQTALYFFLGFSPASEPVVADFNRDGNMDVAYIGKNGLNNATRFDLALGLGNGTFQLTPGVAIPGGFDGGNGQQRGDVGDFNGDGYPDIAWRTQEALNGLGSNGNFSRVDVLLFDPVGQRFRVLADSTNLLGPEPKVNSFYIDTAIGYADLDGDGRQELFAHSVSIPGANGAPGTPERFTVWRPTLDPSATDASQLFTRTEIDNPGMSPATINGYASGDFNHDGHTDLAWVNSYGYVTVAQGNGDFTFRNLTAYLTNSNYGLRVGDVNGDGNLDLINAYSNFGNFSQRPLLSVLLGKADGTFGSAEPLGTIYGNAQTLAVGDFNLDGKTDFATHSNNNLAEVFLSAPPGLAAVESGDLNGDGKLDLVGITTGFNRVKVLLGNGDNTFTRQDDLFVGASPVDLRLADIDGDGKLDIVTANRVGQSITVLHNGAGSFTRTDYALQARPSKLAVADLDGDGRPDVAAISESGQTLEVLVNSATGLGAATALNLGFAPGDIALADVTGDGKADAVITDPVNKRIFILPGLGDGMFGAALMIPLTAAPRAVALADMNGDGKLDIIVTDPDDGRVGILFNRGGGRFTAPQTIRVGDGPNALAVQDVNGDGKPDLLVTNSDNTVSVILNRFDPSQLYRYTPTAVDPDGDPITFNLDTAPGGMLYDDATGQILWAPMPDQIGDSAVVVSASDGRGGSATQGFSIHVSSPTTTPAPVFTSQPVAAIPVDIAYSYQPSSTNPGNNPLRYRLVNGPAGMSVDPTTGAVRWDPRQEGLSLDFYRTDQARFVNRGYIQTADSPSLESASVSAEGWFKFDVNTGVQGLIRKNIYTGFNGNVVSWSLDNAGGSLHLRVGNVGNYFDAYAPTALPTGQWLHLAFTFDGATNAYSLYVNGALVLSGISTLPISYDGNPLIVGQNLIGSLTDVRVWNRVLTPAEIAAGLNSEVPPDSPGLVLDYSFDGGPAAASVLDLSPSRNHGGIVTDFDPYHYPQRGPALSFTGTFPVTIEVEDGKGGIGTQTFNVDIVSSIRESVVGTVSDGATAAGLGGWTVFVDANRNGYRDAGEAFAVTDSSGHYTLPGLLAGTTPLAVEARAGFDSPTPREVVIAAGQATTADFSATAATPGTIGGKVTIAGTSTPAVGFAVYIDANGNGVRDAGEPEGFTDRLGNYVLGDLAAGSYSVRVDAPAGWSTAAPASGSFNVVLPANGTVAGGDFTLNATAEAASAPVFVSTPPANTAARSQFFYSAVAVDPLARPITYSLLVGPATMAIDPVTGVLVWTPTASETGSTRVIIKAANDTGGIAIQDFSLVVTAPNSAPIITSNDTATAYQDLPFFFAVQAQDAEQASLGYALATAPAGMTIDAITGRIAWTPTVLQLGLQTATVIVTDGAGTETRETISFTVLASGANAAPVIASGPRPTAQVGSAYLWVVTATDADGDSLTFSLLSGPPGLLVGADGRVTWTPTSAQFGANALRVQVDDDRGGSDVRDFSIDVGSTLANRPPMLAPVAPAFAVVGNVFARNLSATDADGDALAYQLVGGPAGLSLDSALGTLRWEPGRDQLGANTVTVRVLDPFGGVDEKTFSITVRGVGGPPAITSIPPTSASVGQTYLYSVVANDAEGNPLTYSLSASPAGMNIDAATGIVAWTPAVGQVGPQPVIVRVSDGAGGFTTQAFSIVVTAGVPNQPPVATTLPPLEAVVGTPFVYTLHATDPEGGAVAYALRSGPVGFAIDSSSGVVTWTPGAADIGTAVIVLTATDPGGAAAVQSFLVSVAATNHPPVIVSSALPSVPQGGAYRYDLNAQDADHEPLTYELVGGPTGMTLDSLGRVRWQTALDAPLGTRTATFTVRDGRGGSVTQTIQFDVVADTTPPRVSIIVHNGLLYPWSTEPATVKVTATDDVGVTNITLMVDGNAVALAPDGTASVFFSGPGNGRLEAFATDAAGNTGRGFAQVTERSGTEDGSGNGNAAPTAAITSVNDGDQVGGFVSIVGTAASADLTEYVLRYRRMDENAFHEFGRGNASVTNGVLGTWDTTLLENEQYEIQLEATDQFGNFADVERTVGVSGNFKLGNFRLSFADITVPVAGIPITLARTYDTLKAAQNGELGYGWSLEFRDANLRTGLPKTGLEDLGIYSAFKSGTKVYITLPGGQREGFTFTPDIRTLGGFGASLTIATPRFTADRGVTDTLSVQGGTFIVNEFGELIGGGGQPYNPAAEEFGGGYMLTTKEGIRYRIDGNTGLLNTATDRNGNTVAFTDAGISGNGVSVTFERDAKGRITKATDPAGNSVRYAYDSAGNLAAVTDREGNVTNYVYKSTPAHYLDSVIDPLGRTGTRMEYGPDGRLSATIDALGNAVRTSYDPDNSLATVLDQLGNPTVIETDRLGNVVAVTDALGGVIRNTYDANGFVLSVTDALGRITAYTRDSAGNELTRTDALGNITRITYDAYGNALGTTDPLGNSSTFGYDTRGNLVRVTDALGNAAAVSVDASGSATGATLPGGAVFSISGGAAPAAVTDPRGVTFAITYDALLNPISRTTAVTEADGIHTLVERTEYDAEGRVTAKTDAAGATTRTEYDAEGNVAAFVDPVGRRVAYDYDAAGRPVAVRYSDGTADTTTYDAAGRAVAKTDRAGRTTRYVYDAVGRLTGIVLPDATPADDSDNPRTATEYDAAGEASAEIDASGRRTAFEYDADGRQIAVRYATGAVERAEYDAAGRQTLGTDALGRTTYYEYDALGRQTAAVLPDGGRVSTVLNAAGLVTSRTDPAGRTTHFEYTPGGLLSAVVDPFGNRTAHEYDELGRRTATTDALGRTTHFEYDDAGRRIAVVLPTGERSGFNYDAAGRLVTETGFDGRVTAYRYESADRTVFETRPDGTSIRRTYTPTGRTAEVDDIRGATLYEYDALDRLLARIEPDGRTVRYAYDEVGNRTETIVPSGTTRSAYDAGNRLVEVTGPDGGTTRYDYDAAGELVRTRFPNGTEETLAYDAAGRLLTQVTTGAGGAILASFTYTYDTAGHRASTTEAGGRRTDYTYDADDRLVSESVTDPTTGAHSTTYAYDAVGNRIRRTDSTAGVTTYGYDARDRLTSETTGATTVFRSYDANGNLTVRDGGATDRSEYEWNADGRLVAAMETDTTGTREAAYVYDADGNLVGRAEDGTETRFLVDAAQSNPTVLEEYRPDGTVVAAYTYGLDRISRTTAAGVAFYVTDALGSVRALTDAAGTVTDTFSYTGFGELAAKTGATTNPFLFAGEARDGLTGLDYLRARHYDPTTGRFASRDPFAGSPAVPASLNSYAYAHGDPVSLTDPSGRSPLGELMTGLFIRGTLIAQRLFVLKKVNDTVSFLRELLFWYTLGNQLNRFMIDYTGGVYAAGAIKATSTIVKLESSGTIFREFKLELGISKGNDILSFSLTGGDKNSNTSGKLGSTLNLTKIQKGDLGGAGLDFLLGFSGGLNYKLYEAPIKNILKIELYGRVTSPQRWEYHHSWEKIDAFVSVTGGLEITVGPSLKFVVELVPGLPLALLGYKKTSALND